MNTEVPCNVSLSFHHIEITDNQPNQAGSNNFNTEVLHFRSHCILQYSILFATSIHRSFSRPRIPTCPRQLVISFCHDLTSPHEDRAMTMFSLDILHLLKKPSGIGSHQPPKRSVCLPRLSTPLSLYKMTIVASMLSALAVAQLENRTVKYD